VGALWGMLLGIFSLRTPNPLKYKKCIFTKKPKLLQKFNGISKSALPNCENNTEKNPVVLKFYKKVAKYGENYYNKIVKRFAVLHGRGFVVYGFEFNPPRSFCSSTTN